MAQHVEEGVKPSRMGFDTRTQSLEAIIKFQSVEIEKSDSRASDPGRRWRELEDLLEDCAPGGNDMRSLVIEPMVSHVPRILLDLLKRGEVKAPMGVPLRIVLMIADLSGFTSRTEACSQRGAQGLDDLIRLINETFGSMLTVIGKHGGDVVRFAGDALIVMWDVAPEKNSAESALACATELSCVSFPDNMTLHAGLACGDAEFLIVGQDVEDGENGAANLVDQCFILFSPVIFDAGNALDLAKSGEVVVCDSAALGGGLTLSAALEGGLTVAAVAQSSGSYDAVELQPNSSGADKERGESARYYHVVARTDRAGESDPSPEPMLQCSVELARRLFPFFPSCVNVGSGEMHNELREVSIAFAAISCDELDSALRCRTSMNDDDDDVVRKGDESEPLSVACGVLQRCYVLAMAELHRHDGYLRQFLLDDKGLVLIAAFGVARCVHHQDATRALAFALTLRHSLEGGITGTAVHVGVTTGRAFCGNMGMKEKRCEYAIVGDVVNRSARLMGVAMKHDGFREREGTKGGVLCDAAAIGAHEDWVTSRSKIRQSIDYTLGDGLSFESIGEIHLKGKSSKETCMREQHQSVLITKKNRRKSVSSGGKSKCYGLNNHSDVGADVANANSLSLRSVEGAYARDVESGEGEGRAASPTSTQAPKRSQGSMEYRRRSMPSVIPTVGSEVTREDCIELVTALVDRHATTLSTDAAQQNALQEGPAKRLTGGGGLVILEGEPGSGKSVFFDFVADYAMATHSITTVNVQLRETDVQVPYLMVSKLISAILDHVDPSRELFASFLSSYTSSGGNGFTDDEHGIGTQESSSALSNALGHTAMEQSDNSDDSTENGSSARLARSLRILVRVLHLEGLGIAGWMPDVARDVEVADSNQVQLYEKKNTLPSEKKTALGPPVASLSRSAKVAPVAPAPTSSPTPADLSVVWVDLVADAITHIPLLVDALSRGMIIVIDGAEWTDPCSRTIMMKLCKEFMSSLLICLACRISQLKTGDISIGESGKKMPTLKLSSSFRGDTRRQSMLTGREYVKPIAESFSWFVALRSLCDISLAFPEDDEALADMLRFAEDLRLNRLLTDDPFDKKSRSVFVHLEMPPLREAGVRDMLREEFGSITIEVTIDDHAEDTADDKREKVNDHVETTAAASTSPRSLERSFEFVADIVWEDSVVHFLARDSAGNPMVCSEIGLGAFTEASRIFEELISLELKSYEDDLKKALSIMMAQEPASFVVSLSSLSPGANTLNSTAVRKGAGAKLDVTVIGRDPEIVKTVRAALRGKQVSESTKKQVSDLDTGKDPSSEVSSCHLSGSFVEESMMNLMTRAVLARLDSLPFSAQTVLKAASVIGIAFNLEMLVTMLPQSVKRKTNNVAKGQIRFGSHGRGRSSTTRIVSTRNVARVSARPAKGNVRAKDDSDRSKALRPMQRTSTNQDLLEGGVTTPLQEQGTSAAMPEGSGRSSARESHRWDGRRKMRNKTNSAMADGVMIRHPLLIKYPVLSDALNHLINSSFISLGAQVTASEDSSNFFGVLNTAENGGNVDKDLQFFFSHEIIRAITYDLLTVRERRFRHQQAAYWIESKNGDNLRPFFRALMQVMSPWHHYREAGQLRLSMGYAIKQFNILFSSNAFVQGLALVEDVLDFITPETPERDRSSLDKMREAMLTYRARRGSIFYLDPDDASNNSETLVKMSNPKVASLKSKSFQRSNHGESVSAASSTRSSPVSVSSEKDEECLFLRSHFNYLISRLDKELQEVNGATTSSSPKTTDQISTSVHSSKTSMCSLL